MTECSSDGCRFNENCVASGSTGFCEAIQFNTGIKDAEGLEFGGISFVTEDNLDCLKEQGLCFVPFSVENVLLQASVLEVFIMILFKMN